jgi:hypothetical protein
MSSTVNRKALPRCLFPQGASQASGWEASDPLFGDRLNEGAMACGMRNGLDPVAPAKDADASRKNSRLSVELILPNEVSRAGGIHLNRFGSEMDLGSP